MFGPPGLHKYVIHTTIPRIPETSWTNPPPEGHKSHRNHLNVKSEEYRRLENIFRIDSWSLNFQAHFRLLPGTLKHVKEEPFQLEDLHATEKLSLKMRRRGAPSDKLERPIDTIDRLGALLDALPLMSAQRLFHMVYPKTLDWRFQQNSSPHVDQKIFNYFIWSRQPQGDGEPENPLIVAYQPPWILSPADFLEFTRTTSLPPHVPSGHVYPTELTSKHRIWAKLYDTCIKHKTRWFIITSWNLWAFGGFSDGWYSGFISDKRRSDEDPPAILECITFWIASAMNYEGGYVKRRVPEPISFQDIDIATPVEMPPPEDSESNWVGKGEDPSSPVRLSSISDFMSHAGLEDYAPSPFEKGRPLKIDSIRKWREEIAGGQGGIDTSGGNYRTPVGNDKIRITGGDWLF